MRLDTGIEIRLLPEFEESAFERGFDLAVSRCHALQTAHCDSRLSAGFVVELEPDRHPGDGEQRELLRDVQTEIKAIIQEYGSKNGYDFIFTDAGVAYGSDAVNITQDILDELKK